MEITRILAGMLNLQFTEMFNWDALIVITIKTHQTRVISNPLQFLGSGTTHVAFLSLSLFSIKANSIE